MKSYWKSIAKLTGISGQWNILKQDVSKHLYEIYGIIPILKFTDDDIKLDNFALSKSIINRTYLSCSPRTT